MSRTEHHWFGPALRAAATGQDTEASGADEGMVLAAQELVNLVRAGK